MRHILSKHILSYFHKPHNFPQPSFHLVMETDNNSLKRSRCSAQIAQKIDTLPLQVELNIS